MIVNKNKGKNFYSKIRAVLSLSILFPNKLKQLVYFRNFNIKHQQQQTNLYGVSVLIRLVRVNIMQGRGLHGIAV